MHGLMHDCDDPSSRPVPVHLADSHFVPAAPQPSPPLQVCLIIFLPGTFSAGVGFKNLFLIIFANFASATFLVQVLLFWFRGSLRARSIVDQAYRWGGDGGWVVVAFLGRIGRRQPAEPAILPTLCTRRMLDFFLGYFLFAFLFLFSFLVVFDKIQGALLFNMKFAKALERSRLLEANYLTSYVDRAAERSKTTLKAEVVAELAKEQAAKQRNT